MVMVYQNLIFPFHPLLALSYEATCGLRAIVDCLALHCTNIEELMLLRNSLLFLSDMTGKDEQGRARTSKDEQGRARSGIDGEK